MKKINPGVVTDRTKNLIDFLNMLLAGHQEMMLSSGMLDNNPSVTISAVANVLAQNAVAFGLPKESFLEMCGEVYDVAKEQEEKPKTKQ